MPFKPGEREYRVFSSVAAIPSSDENTPAYQVKGRAVVFDSPTCLAEFEGVDVTANLSGTDEGRKLWEEIRGGYIDKMSFAFTVADDGEEYDAETHTRRVTKIRKLYDVSAVDMPAYEQTSISARKSFEAERQKDFEKLEQERRRKLAIAMTYI